MEQTLGKRIMICRKNLGLTQDALAEQLGVTAQAVSKWENDQSCPDINMLPKLAEIFGTTTDELLGVTPQPVHQGEVVSEPAEEDDGNGWEFHWDSGRKTSIGTAVLVLLVGSLLLASNILNWGASFWEILWPSALLVFGVVGLFPKFSFVKTGCALFGGYFLISNLGLLTVSIGKEVIFPVLILLFGLSLLADALRKPKKPMVQFKFEKNGEKTQTSEYSTEGESFTCSQTFGENKHYIALPRLSGGDVSCTFGELMIDLSGCETVSEGCRIDVGCTFGEVKFLVPRRFRAETDISTAFGNVDNSSQPDPGSTGTIVLSGSVSFGEIEIRYI